MVVNYSSPLCNECANAFSPWGTGFRSHLVCMKCGKVFWKLPPNGPSPSAVFVVYTRGKVSKKAPASIPHMGWKYRRLVWQKGQEGGRDVVYFPCGQCGRILETAPAEIGREDVIESETSALQRYSCIKCDHCGCHTWPYFEGFGASERDAPKEPGSRKEA